MGLVVFVFVFTIGVGFTTTAAAVVLLGEFNRINIWQNTTGKAGHDNNSQPAAAFNDVVSV